jgi:crotonobetainyl-CoA:carnitine CoA-transferase CaiB-like acyl-CoA transferase
MSIARDALDQLLGIAGREPADFARLEEGPPAMETRFHAEAAAAAVLAATGVIAADLWQDRTGETQTVTVSTREAGTGLISFLHQVFEDPTLAPPLRPDDATRGTPAMGFFPARDGRFVYLHPSFPASAAKLHALMGSPADKEAVAAAVLGWNAMDLENAIAEAGICGAMARTPQEWDASEQGRTLAARPVVEVTRIADGPRVPLPAGGTAPLSGVRVLDLTRVLAGPTCARTLAQYGADVLHVASPHLPFTAGFVTDTNHGKLSAHLDLTDPADLARLKALVATADVFSQGYRTGGLERWAWDLWTWPGSTPGSSTPRSTPMGTRGPGGTGRAGNSSPRPSPASPICAANTWPAATRGRSCSPARSPTTRPAISRRWGA